jgi:hypothetical protein
LVLLSQIAFSSIQAIPSQIRALSSQSGNFEIPAAVLTRNEIRKMNRGRQNKPGCTGRRKLGQAAIFAAAARRHWGTRILVSLGALLALAVRADVRVFIENSNGVALVEYQCTAGESIRAFALNISVDRGTIVGISGFVRGPSTAAAPGYGIFPASFRDHLQAGDGTNVDWSVKDYSPLAASTDAPDDTLSGLGSNGVTLEFGALWDPTVPEAAPKPTGTLCTLSLSQPANVSVSANVSRGGVVGVFAGVGFTSVFTGVAIGPSIVKATLGNGGMTLLFNGGELQTAPQPSGPWTDTGDSSGTHNEPLGTNQTRFYRVRGP